VNDEERAEFYADPANRNPPTSGWAFTPRRGWFPYGPNPGPLPGSDSWKVRWLDMAYPKQNIWVVPAGLGWRVRREEGEVLTEELPTKDEAMDVARQYARADKVELIWQGEDGRIQGRDSYGNDPARRPG
jgi:hypothetical protein